MNKLEIVGVAKAERLDESRVLVRVEGEKPVESMQYDNIEITDIIVSNDLKRFTKWILKNMSLSDAQKKVISEQHIEEEVPFLKAKKA
jgi:galactokinase/mevalonate kinase-like predicted kinase